MSLSNKILLGLGLGAFVGLFLGEYAAPLTYVGDAFIGLLQMTVLPYIMLSLIVNIGKLSGGRGWNLVSKGLGVLVMLILLGLGIILILPLAFPDWESGSFYNPAFVEKSPPLDFIALYIPSNPFHSLANNMVPAVVLFSILLGSALIAVPNKEGLLNGLDALTKGLNQVNKMVVRLTPVGVFAIAASTVGTMSWEEMSRIQSYLLVYTLAVLILTFWVLPMIVRSFTPYSYKDIFGYTRATLITIFATGKIIVVLPQLMENVENLIHKYYPEDKETHAQVEVLMPLAYPFPNLGTLAIFVFIPFAAWFSGSELVGDQIPLFFGSTLLSSFVAPITSIPFILDTLEIPKDMFHLFAVSTVYTDRIRVVLGAMHLITLTLLTISLSNGHFRLKIRRLVPGIIVSVLLFGLGIFGINSYLTFTLKDAYTKDQLINNMELLQDTVHSQILTHSFRNPKRLYRSQTRISRIKNRGKIRIGFYEEKMPFTYLNPECRLIGFDVDMANSLATDLGVTIEWVPIEIGSMRNNLKADHYDIVMSSVALSGQYQGTVSFSRSYLDVTMAIVVAVDKEEFRSFEELSELDSFTLGYLSRRDFAEKVKRYLPKAILVDLNSMDDFFDPDTVKAEALLTSAERGYTMTLRYPNYQVVNPLPYPITVPLAYPLPMDDPEFKAYIDEWVEVKEKDGTIAMLYDHWILGKDILKGNDHWSIMKDVLHWVK